MNDEHKTKAQLIAELIALREQMAEHTAAPTVYDDTAARLVQSALNMLFLHAAVVRADGLIVTVNAAWDDFARANGDPDLLTTSVGVNYFDVCRRAMATNAPGAAEALAGLLAVLQGERPFFELRYSCHSPTQPRWFMLYAMPLFQYTVRHLLVIHADITAHTLAELALHESEERYRAVFETIASLAYIFQIQPNGTRLPEWVTPGASRIIGFDQATMLQPETWQRITHPADWPIVQRQIDELLANRSATAEYRLVSASGEVRWVLDYARPEWDVTHQRVTRIYGALQDVTERKRVEDRSKALIERAPDGITLLGTTGLIKYISPSVEKIFGYRPEDLAYIDPAELTHPADRSMVLVALTALIRDPAYVPTLQYRFQHRNGRWLWVESTFSNLLAEPAVEAIVINFRDITEHKQAEAELQQLNSELEQRVAHRTAQLAAANERLTELDRLKSQFIADVSHELRTPVASLGLYIGLLNQGLPDKHDYYLAQATSQMTRLRGLIEEILDLSRLERRAEALNREVLDLNEIMAQVVDEQQPLAEAAGLTLLSRPATEALQVQGDHSLLLRAIRNLVTNGIKYTRAGQVYVTTLSDGVRVGVEVRDTGQGIAPDDLLHVFDRFYRGKQVVRSMIPGTGLGLAIVKEIVEAHGGSVEVESTLGQGSTFWLWVPRLVD